MKSIINAGKFKNRRDTSTELYKTEVSVINDIVKNILFLYPKLKDKIWVDPFADVGQWGSVFSLYDIKHFSYDIRKTENANVVQKDFFELELNENMFVIGNPPFKLTKKIADKLIKNKSDFFLLGGSSIWTNTLSKHVNKLFVFEGFEGNQKDKRTKLKFLDSNNNKVMIWCVGALSIFDDENKISISFEDKNIATSPFKGIQLNENIVSIKNK